MNRVKNKGIPIGFEGRSRKKVPNEKASEKFKALLDFIRENVDDESGELRITMEQLMARMGASRTTIDRQISELTKEKAIAHYTEQPAPVKVIRLLITHD